MSGLETERLVFEQWHEADFSRVREYFSKEANTHFLGGVKGSEESWRLIATYVGHYEFKGYSYLAVRIKDTRELIGSIGLWNSEPWPELELGYWLFAEFQGQGYGAEAAMAARDYAFDTLKEKTLVSYIEPSNEASIKLAKRLGAVREGSIELLDFGKHDVYRYIPKVKSEK